MACRVVTFLERNEVPIQVAAIGRKPPLRQQERAGEAIGDQFTGGRQRLFRRNAQALEHTIGGAFANFVCHRPLFALGTLGDANDDRALTAAVRVVLREPHVTTPAWQAVISGDDKTQTLEENLTTLSWMVGRLGDRRYDISRRDVVADGLWQLHVLRGTVVSTGKPFAMPAAMLLTMADGRITRIAEYLDPLPARALAG